MKMNVPNALTVLRIVLIPLFLWRFLTAQTQLQFYAAALTLGVSALSDTLDGYIARRCNQITQLGKILDPIADKLTLASVVAVFILKEFLMLVGGLRLHRKRVTIEGAKWFGKLATVMFYVIMITIVAFPSLSDGTILAMLLLLLVFMLFSLLRYGVMFWGMLRSAKKR